MKYLNRCIIFAAVASLTMAASAQSKKPATKKPVVEEAPVDTRYERMIQNTQKVVFIDSMLVPRSDMLSKIKYTPRTGIIRAEQQGYSYQNEIGTRKIAAHDGKLHESMLVGNTFMNEDELKGLYSPSVIDSLDYPFLMNDGTTLYFSAKGSESIGGYDIFVTRYNAETHTFLRPENIGMPFNSKGDDILYIIDEESNIGYFATTRRQPAGYVCIYTFIPNEVRQAYNETAPGQLKRLADIDRIADTWGDGRERAEALKRLENSNTQPSTLNAQPSILYPQRFVINDETVYTSASDFKAVGNGERYQQLLVMQNQLNNIEEELKTARINYSRASAAQRDQLGREILTLEKKAAQQEHDIQLMEQDIRYSENQLLNH